MLPQTPPDSANEGSVEQSSVFDFQTGCKCDSTTEIQFTGLFLQHVQR